MLRVPVRRSLWASLFVGLAAGLFSLLAAAAGSSLLLLLPSGVDGAWVVFAFALLWFGLFFLSLPGQRRYARSRDLRRPGISLADGALTVPLPDETALRVELGDPRELRFGWFEVVTKSTGGPTTNTRGVMTYAVVSQAGRGLLLFAEDSVAEARAAGWPNVTSPATPDLRVRLWAADLVRLVEALRAQPATPAPGQATTMTGHGGESPRETFREWPENPLPARNRHEAALFLEWLKAEVVARAPAEGEEVCVARVPGADPAREPDAFRFVFRLLEPDPEDENDFGSGASRILDAADLMLLLSRMEREGRFGLSGSDARLNASLVLTHRTTREVEALARANARGVALIEQLTRFTRPDGSLDEESVKVSAKRAWLRGARERFNPVTLEEKRKAFAEARRLLELPAADSAGEGRQAALVRELRASCPEYVDELGRAGFEGRHLLHPLFSHAYHLTRFAARALRDGEAPKARAAFGAWAAAEPDELLFPVREFAEASFELKLEPRAALDFVPPGGRHWFSTSYDALADPGYNPWSY